jgi:hypothetical protein
MFQIQLPIQAEEKMDEEELNEQKDNQKGRRDI